MFRSVSSGMTPLAVSSPKEKGITSSSNETRAKFLCLDGCVSLDDLLHDITRSFESHGKRHIKEQSILTNGSALTCEDRCLDNNTMEPITDDSACCHATLGFLCGKLIGN